jgi:hypothetical protein
LLRHLALLFGDWFMQHYSKLSHREVLQVVAVSNEEDTIVLILVA